MCGHIFSLSLSQYIHLTSKRLSVPNASVWCIKEAFGDFHELEQRYRVYDSRWIVSANSIRTLRKDLLKNWHSSYFTARSLHKWLWQRSTLDHPQFRWYIRAISMNFIPTWIPFLIYTSHNRLSASCDMNLIILWASIPFLLCWRIIKETKYDYNDIFSAVNMADH